MASVNPADRKTKLSKNLSQMTFMQRAKQKEEKEEKEAVVQRAIDDDHWVLDVPELAKKESQFISEPSYIICMSLLFGRGSFHGFNPEIEKIYKEKNEEIVSAKGQNVEQDEEFDETVDDIEMTERFSSLVGTLAKKMSKKRDRSRQDGNVEAPTKERKSRKRSRNFLRPSDD